MTVGTLAPLPSGFGRTRRALHLVAVHVVARSRHAATGRFGLRVTPGGFGTPAFGAHVEVVRVTSDALLVRERAGVDGASSHAVPIAGSSLADLAAVAGVDLGSDFSAGDDTPPLGDHTIALDVDAASTSVLGAWFTFGAAVLDAALANDDGSPSVVQLWPEHFDVSVDVAVAPGRRVNVGASPGDDLLATPYLYVGPWDRTALDDAFWNAPFGAALTYDELLAASEPALARASS